MLALVRRAILRRQEQAYPKDGVWGKHAAVLLAFFLV